MARKPRDITTSSLLLIALLAAVALLFALLGGTVMLPLGGVAVWIVLGVLFFIGAQFLLFRALGLRSRADEGLDEGESSTDEDEQAEADWRAWRG